ncbi:MAG: hypothetical protein AAGF54_08115 [Pseudomonadota bacterium]
MADFVLAFHGGKMPETDEQRNEVMGKWNNWMEGLGDKLVNPGAPVGMSKTITANGVEDNGGSNPLSGLTIISADNIDAAIALAKPCPHLEYEGTIEVAEMMQM